MGIEENIFDINRVLKNEYHSRKNILREKNIELIFEMGKTIPRELKGNDVAFTNLLSILLDFILKNIKSKEILLSLEAPNDFLYEELISFKITETGISKEKILAFLEVDLENNLKLLDGKINYDSDVDIHIDIPFIIGELGYRRHYRLPKKSMLNKKVLIITESDNITRSITTMLKYFPYDVDIRFKEFKEENINLSMYDLMIMEDKLVTESFLSILKKIQNEKDLKFVVLCDEDAARQYNRLCVSTCLVKPITQESIFELIVSVFEHPVPKHSQKKASLDTKIKEISSKNNTKIKETSNPLHSIIEEKKSKYTMILDTRIGLENAKKYGTRYSDELENFLETFDRSDLYFRQIVNEKQTTKIKDFCIDLEKQSKIIGAESMQKFADIVSLIFVYDKLEMLPIYPGRYHIELEKLIIDIEKYLGYR